VGKRETHSEDDGRVGIDVVGLVDTQLDAVGVGRVGGVPDVRGDERQVVLGGGGHRLDGGEARQGHGQSTEPPERHDVCWGVWRVMDEGMVREICQWEGTAT